METTNESTVEIEQGIGNPFTRSSRLLRSPPVTKMSGKVSIGVLTASPPTLSFKKAECVSASEGREMEEEVIPLETPEPENKGIPPMSRSLASPFEVAFCVSSRTTQRPKRHGC